MAAWVLITTLAVGQGLKEGFCTSGLLCYSSLMKPINTLLVLLFISLLSSPSQSETYDDLVEREGLWYKKFTDVPFTGEITGDIQGSLKNGEKEGDWVWYRENGQLFFKSNYQNGRLNGASVSYHDIGQLWFKGNHKNDEKDGAWIRYYANGQLEYKGNFKNGNKLGVWVGYNEDGTVDTSWTGTFKNGVKISD